MILLRRRRRLFGKVESVDPLGWSQLSSLQEASFITWHGQLVIGADVMTCDAWQRIFLETMRRLESFRRRVREGVAVEDCQSFARYVQWSGIADQMLLEPPASAKLREMFPYDGAALLREAKALEAECCEYFQRRTCRSEGTPAGANKSDLEDIGRKLELVLTRLTALESGKPVPVRKPSLRVVRASSVAR